MDRWTDLHKKNTTPATISLVKEVFDTSHDIFERVKQEEKNLETAIRNTFYEPKKHKKKSSIGRKILGMFHFATLTTILFFILLVISNWSAYSTFAGAFLSPEKLQNEQKNLE